MNPEEAKVPNVEGDWQSIEIFLFSNGQQYTPPRKYLLRIDELNLWDATLNQLARAHYGLQSPLINLYTTSGHLVKGPLDLRDGQAYVAVAPPDTFVDAGYQKYLIKASRSWEKRQARKKPPECVPNEPCCLCSEKGRSCCDPDACCLCPEKEDADSVELLLPATGHPESRSAGGHYMSSAPAKPDSADDYEPISGNIGHDVTCKHCGQKASPGDFGYSPILVPDNQNGYEAGLSDNRATLAENGARNDENVARPSEYESRPSKNSTRSGGYGAKQGEHETRPNVNGVRPGEFGAGPPEYGTRQGENEMKSSVNGTRPDKFVGRPTEYETRQGENETRPSINGVRQASPGEFGSRPAEYETKPSANGAKLGGNGTRLGEYETKPSANGAKLGANGTRPGEYGGRSSEYKTRSSVNGARPGEYENKTSTNGAKPVEYGARQDKYDIRQNTNGAKPVEYGTKAIEYETIPSLNGIKQAQYDTRPDEYKARLGEYGTKPSANGAKLDGNGTRLGEYETKASANGAKLGANGTRLSEYETRPGEYGGRPSEYKTRSSVNGARPGEYENKTSTNGAKPAEYGARQGKYNIKQNINGAKPVEFGAEPAEYGTRAVEYETMSSLNGIKQAQYETRPDEYKARLGEYEIKPIVNGAQPGESRFGTRTGENGARLDEYETTPSKNTTKVGEYDTRKGEYDTKPDEYVTKPSVNGAKPSEYRAEPGKYDNKQSGPTTGEYKVKSGEYATHSAEQENRPDGYGSSPAKNGAWTGEDGDRPTGHKARPGFSGPRLSKIEPIKEAYEIALRKNEKSLDESENRLEKDIIDKDASIKGPTRLVGENEKEKKGEYKTRDGDQKVKEIESNDRSSGNGKNGGERRISGGEKNIRENDTVTRVGESKARKIENTRRLSGRGGVETDQGRKPGELTKDFEHGGKVNIQKGRETNPAGRAGGNGARMSEQRNKQSDNLAKLGGRESRVGDHEARAGDVGFPTSDQDTGLGFPNSREAEPSTRAAVSGARANPKDRIHSRVKPGYLGQPKIGTPGTKVEEALDDSVIKTREGNPVARQSRVGGTGAAGSLHISETQQHGRRISLSAGRPSIEKKRLPVGQNSSLVRKPTPNSSILRKLEDDKPLKTNKENLPKKINEPASTIPVSNESRKSKTLPKSQPTTPLLHPFSTISVTNIASQTTDKVIFEKCIDEKEIIVSTHSFKNPESETRSMKLDSVKHNIDVIENTMEETQTELMYTEKSFAYVPVDEGVQTNRETVEQREQEVSASSKEKFNSCTCTLCKPIYDKATFDSDENTLSMLNKGGVVNIKLNIEVRNIVKSVYSCHKNCGRSRSLTNITGSEKESQISIDKDMVVNHNSLQSLFTKQNFRGFGFDGSPNVMVVQCAGCGKPNSPRCDQSPPCCDNSKKYFVLLNSVLEDKEDGCDFNPPCRPCDQRQSRKQSSGIPIKQAFSETTLDTITTVTVSGVPLQRREIGKCMTNTSCQTEEPRNEGMMANRKVSITQDSVTKCDIEKKGNSSICVSTQAVNLVPKQSCLKMCSQKCEQEFSQVCPMPCPSTPPPICEKVRSVCSHVPPQTGEKDRPYSQVPPPTCQKVQLICSHVPPVPCEREQSVCLHVHPPVYEKVRSICSHVPPAICQKIQSLYSQEPPPVCEKQQSVCSQVPPEICQKVQPDGSHVSPPKCEKVRSVCSQVSSQTGLQVQSKGCQPTSPHVQPQECMPMPPCCPKTTPQCIQVQAQAYLQIPEVCNAETQTRWASILLQARLHRDGRYSFHLPPLCLLKNNYSCCQ